MKNLLLSVLAISLLGCGDDTKKASSDVESNNTASNNTASNNTASNNTASNNTASNNTNPNNTTANNTANNVSVPNLELGPDTDPISSVDVAQACQKTQAYFAANLSEAELKKFGCLLGGAFTAAFGEFETDAALQTACSEAYNECMAEPTDPEPMEPCDLEPTDCSADIGLVEECIEAQVSGVKTVANSFTCADLTLDSDPTDLSESPSACDQIEAECPDFFGAAE